MGTVSSSYKTSTSTVLRTIYHYLDHPLPPYPGSNLRCHLIIDGTWFGRENVSVVYWDSGLKKVSWFRYSDKERGGEIAQDLIFPLHFGVIRVWVTSDGGAGIKGGVDMIYPEIPHQAV